MNWPIQPLSSLGTVYTGSTPSSTHPTNWPVFSLGNVCSVRRGTTITQNQATPGIITVVAGGLAATYFHDTPNRESNVITVSASGASAGFVNYWETPIFASDCSTVESESPDISIKYVFHFLRGKQEYIYSKLRSGAAQPHVYAKDIASLKILLPPLPEQRRIAAILDQAEALRTKRREALAQLDYLTQSIFIDMFGDPGSNAKKWPVIGLNELIVGKPNNGIFKKNDEYGAGLPVVWVEELFRGNGINCSHSRRLEPSKRELDQYGLHHGDVLFCRSSLKLAGIGYNNVYLGESNKTLFECHVIRISPDKNKLDPMFLNFALRMPNQRQKLFKHAKTVTMSTIDQDGLLRLDLPVPPLHLQKQFARQLDAIEGLKAKHANALAELDALFASLQNRAFHGEL